MEILHFISQINFYKKTEYENWNENNPQTKFYKIV
ncbi:MAG: hypothetical protein UZ11_BCD004000900 [Bacteroidetes bacterium OLB11]|nr:MAG: hypothetical protein UZ11_BCD004000900 [Bacteroidetes bacterium OLB11]